MSNPEFLTEPIPWEDHGHHSHEAHWNNLHLMVKRDIGRQQFLCIVQNDKAPLDPKLVQFVSNENEAKTLCEEHARLDAYQKWLRRND